MWSWKYPRLGGPRRNAILAAGLAGRGCRADKCSPARLARDVGHERGTVSVEWIATPIQFPDGAARSTGHGRDPTSPVACLTAAQA